MSLMDDEQQVFEQDLTNRDIPGIFIMKLMMKEKCSMPEKETIHKIMEKYLGEIDYVSYDAQKGSSLFAAKQYKAEFKDGTKPPMLAILGMEKIGEGETDDFEKSQMWECMEDRDRIFEECGFEVIASDFIARTMVGKERADMLIKYLYALLEMFPQCEAVKFEPSGKMFTAEKILSCDIPFEDKFIYFSVNVRFFNVQGTEDMMVDTLGMSIINMPDLQYHFNKMDPNWVVNHAYNLLYYIFDNDNPIKDGETVDGITDNKMDKSIQWKCRYEDSLIQPIRQVIDINMNEYAAGKRQQ